MQLNAMPRCDDMRLALLTLKYKAGRSAVDRDRTRSRIMTADVADSEFQG